jgi:hypothetical protein
MLKKAANQFGVGTQIAKTSIPSLSVITYRFKNEK